MTNQEFEALTQRIEAGETLAVIDMFLYTQEKRHREAEPNVLQKQAAKRHENPLLATGK